MVYDIYNYSYLAYLVVGPPQLMRFIKPMNYGDIINHSDIGVLCTNLAIVNVVPHIVIFFRMAS